MTRPTARGDCRTFQFVKRSPKALLAARAGQTIQITIATAAGNVMTFTPLVSRLLKFSLRTTDADEARARAGAVTAQIASLVKAIEAGPRTLTHKQAAALAGEAYTGLVADYEQDPGSAAKWAVIGWGFQANRPGSFKPLDDFIAFEVESVLAKHCVVVCDETRRKLATGFRDSLAAGMKHLERNARWDYTPDPNAQRFPKWEDSSPLPALTISGLWEAWKAAAITGGKAAGTISEYNRTIKRFIAFIGHDDARRVSHDDVKRYRDERLNVDGMAPMTLRNLELVALKSLFSFAMREHTDFTVNPASKVTVMISKAMKAQRKRSSYSDDGALKLLQASRSHKRAPNEGDRMAAAKQWIPLLCAQSGARVGELAQLRKQDIGRDRDTNGKLIWTMRITPEAGPVKGGEERIVPLHPQIVSLGFISYVERAADGYLFLEATHKDDVGGKLQALKNRLCEFAKGVVVEARVAPNHGWRHRFITLCRKHGISDEMRDAIVGHAPESTAAKYYGEMAGLYEAICKLPHYDLT